jgi:hypothetical protein
MKTPIRWLSSLVLCGICSITNAQSLPSGTALFPVNPTSADVLKLSLQTTTCGNLYLANQYRVTMVQNAITVSLGQTTNFPVGTCPPAPQEYISIGQLPAGNYTLTVNRFAAAGVTPVAVFPTHSFTVADARTTKSAPYVRLDYSGHWWDPSDPGWGLFIWQDARSAADNLLMAWFTYGIDGKQTWYTSQPSWQTGTATNTADMYQASRMPGPTVPPPNPTTATVAGNAKLDFTNYDGILAVGNGDVGKFIYTIGGGVTLTRNIQRFRP